MKETPTNSRRLAAAGLLLNCRRLMAAGLLIIGRCMAAGLMALSVSAARAAGPDAAPDSIASARVSRTSWSVGYGASRLLDTYLSAERFSGQGVTFLATSDRSRGRNAPWLTTIEHQLTLSRSDNRAETSSFLQAQYELFYGRMHRWWLAGDRLTLEAGAAGNLGLGVVYCTTNGNNPAQGRLHLGIMPTAGASCRFRLLGVDMTGRYRVNLPLVGVMFSPNYGQSYYEIFSRGNYDRNVVFTTPASAPYFRQQLSVDMTLSPRLTLTVGYLGDYSQAKVNHLKYHTYTHSIMIGFVKKFSIISYRP